MNEQLHFRVGDPCTIYSELYVNAKDTSTYLTCVRGKLSRRPCFRGLVFDPIRKVCTTTTTQSTTVPTTTPTAANGQRE